MKNTLVQRSHRAGRYMKDLNKTWHGSKIHQIGFRLSDSEFETLTQMLQCGVSLSNWVSYVMMQFVALQSIELAPAESERVQAALLWVPPSPTPHLKNCKVATRPRDLFMAHFPGQPISRMVRWAMLDEAARKLATPPPPIQLSSYRPVLFPQMAELTGYLNPATGDDPE